MPGWAKSILALVVALGCACSAPPNANEATENGIVRAEVLRDRMRNASDLANLQVAKGVITDSQAQRYIQRVAGDLLDSLDAKSIPEDKAWAYAEVCITARRWQQAEQVLLAATKHPASEDRRVNDTLRLARVEAELGETDAALKSARSVFNAPPSQKAPILLAVLLEIAPAIERQGLKGHEVALARLVEDAIQQHQATVVDPNSDAGRAFIRAKIHHIRRAWELVGQLYRSVNRNDLAAEAARREKELMPSPSIRV